MAVESKSNRSIHRISMQLLYLFHQRASTDRQILQKYTERYLIYYVTHCHAPLSNATLGKLLIHMCLCHQAVWNGTSWAGKVTVDLASHWPRVTDSSDSSTYGLKAIEVGNISQKARGQHKYHAVKQWKNTINQHNHKLSSAWALWRWSSRHG